MCSLIDKQLLLTAYAYLFIMEQQKVQQGSQALELEGRNGDMQREKNKWKKRRQELNKGAQTTKQAAAEAEVNKTKRDGITSKLEGAAKAEEDAERKNNNAGNKSDIKLPQKSSSTNEKASGKSSEERSEDTVCDVPVPEKINEDAERKNNNAGNKSDIKLPQESSSTNDKEPGESSEECSDDTVRDVLVPKSITESMAKSKLKVKPIPRKSKSEAGPTLLTRDMKNAATVEDLDALKSAKHYKDQKWAADQIDDVKAALQQDMTPAPTLEVLEALKQKTKWVDHKWAVAEIDKVKASISNLRDAAAAAMANEVLAQISEILKLGSPIEQRRELGKLAKTKAVRRIYADNREFNQAVEFEKLLAALAELDETGWEEDTFFEQWRAQWNEKNSDKNKLLQELVMQQIKHILESFSGKQRTTELAKLKKCVVEDRNVMSEDEFEQAELEQRFGALQKKWHAIWIASKNIQEKKEILVKMSPNKASPTRKNREHPKNR